MIMVRKRSSKISRFKTNKYFYRNYIQND